MLLGVGDGTFVAAVHYAAGDEPFSVAIGDLDGDQVPDLAVAVYLRNNVSVLLGVGDGTFAAAERYGAVGHRPRSVAIGDLDGDQVSDLAVANLASNRVAALLNQSECNGNLIHDDCDIDCGPPGGPCDVPGCGLSEDCNGNGVPDECETDSDGDGVPDDCDICAGGDDSADADGDGVPDFCDPCPDDNPDDTDGDGVCDTDDLCPDGDDNVDVNGNGIPDGCDVEAPILAPAPHDILKNRYLSIDPRGANQVNFGKNLDIRLTLFSTLVSGVPAGQIGSQWWANAPDADCIAVVGSTRPALPPNWDACPTLHLTGCPIIPTSSYDIVVVDGNAESDPPLAAATQAKPGTKWHGDCVGFFDGLIWTAPNGQTNIDDAVAAIKTFQNPSATPSCGTPPCNATHVSVTDMEPNLTPGPQINSVVNIADVFSIILGFQGTEYPGTDLTQCP